MFLWVGFVIHVECLTNLRRKNKAVGCDMELECGLILLIIMFGLAFGTDLQDDY